MQAVAKDELQHACVFVNRSYFQVLQKLNGKFFRRNYFGNEFVIAVGWIEKARSAEATVTELETQGISEKVFRRFSCCSIG